MLLLSTSVLEGYGLHKIFKLVSKSSFDGINLDLNYSNFDTSDADYIKELSDEFNVPVLSITAYERKMNKSEVDNILLIAKKLGVKNINFYPPFRKDKDTTWFSEYIGKVKEKFSDLNICIINVEPRTILFFIPEYKDATLNTIKKITGDTVLCVSSVDITSGIDLLKTFSILGNTIKNVFLSDRNTNKKELFLGSGDMPLESLFVKLKKAGYKGIFTLKINPKEVGVGNEELVLKRLKEARDFIKEQI
ncbi:sugar phosphate isomerase/epimerase [Candidatus Gracilibacteria bacterium]|nr:sugar phosphate isomerase/epimerase [Candidatus Gracilibacteria bacterium]